MATHGNSNDNEAEHHLYEIRDREYKDVYKYGICGAPLTTEGSSPRGKRQAKELNRAVRWLRFFSKVILTGIQGRLAAKEIETEYIENYRQEHGFAPPGNDSEEDTY